MLQSVDGLDLSANVELLCRLIQVLDCRMLWVTTEHLLGLQFFVWLVNIINGQDGQVAIITEIAESDSGSRCNAEFGDSLLGGIESDWHGKKVPIEEAVVGNDTTMFVSFELQCIVVGLVTHCNHPRS